MKRGCFVAAAAVVILALGVVVYAYVTWQSRFNPYWHAKRAYDWADQALGDPDPAARREATAAVLEVFRAMKPGESRIQLTMRFCGHVRLPKEVLPFLLEALHAKEMPPGSYPALALSRVEPAAAIPALAAVIRDDEDAHARAGAVSALSQMDSATVGVEDPLRLALGDKDEEIRKRAAHR